MPPARGRSGCDFGTLRSRLRQNATSNSGRWKGGGSAAENARTPALQAQANAMQRSSRQVRGVAPDPRLYRSGRPNSEKAQITSIRLVPRTERLAITPVGSGIDLRVTHPSPSATPGVASPLNAARRGWWRSRVGNRIRRAHIRRWWGTKFRRWPVARCRTVAGTISRRGAVRGRWPVDRWRRAIPRRRWCHIRSAGRQSPRAEQQRRCGNCKE
jgi:hypothetical protein